jgi:hypothetical protein
MKERPSLMSAPMVLAIIDDKKSKTRRLNGLEFFSENDPENWRCVRVRDGIAFFVYKNSPHEREAKCPYGKIGDRLWVRESWRTETNAHDKLAPSKLRGDENILYEADGNWRDNHTVGRLRPSIHMPRWASRILLEITDLRVERLKDISDADAIAEGVDRTNTSISGYATKRFRRLWESINGPGSWDKNPWVWVISFKRIKP